MKYKICMSCLSKLNEIDCSCQKKNVVEYKNNKFCINGQVYKKQEWYYLITSFYELNNSLKVRRISSDIPPNYIKHVFKRNVYKYTFLGMWLPIIIFFIISIFGIKTALNSFDANLKIYLLFISSVFIFLAGGLIFQYLFLNYRCIFTQSQGYQMQYTRISVNKINERIQILNKYINEEP